jgi:hypothetical protein
MTKGQRVALYVGIYAVAAYGGYMIYANTKMFFIKGLAKMGKLVYSDSYKTFDKEFLRAWYKSAKAGASSFSYNGANYNTQGGTKLK